MRLDNKLNVHAQEFSMNQNARALGFFPPSNGPLLHSKSSSNMQQQLQQLAARRHAVQMANLAANSPRAYLLAAHPLQVQQLGLGMAVQQPQVALVTPASAGNGQSVS